jgi:Mrp family chromosome partitioning ATPase
MAAQASPARTAVIERLFTNLAKPGAPSAPTAPSSGRAVSARDTLGLVPPRARAAAEPRTAAAPPLQPQASPSPAAETPRVTLSKQLDATINLRLAPGSSASAEDAAGQARQQAEPDPVAPALDAVDVSESPAPSAASAATEVVPLAPLSLWSQESFAPTDLPESAAAVEEPPPATASAPAATWRPMLQVEHFVWPRICGQLQMIALGQMEELAGALLAAAGEDHKVLAVGGCRAGDGATTMLLCAGRLLARRGFRVLLADAAFADPQLARRLGMLPQAGWEDALAGRLPLEEVIIDSTADRLAVLPAVPSQSGESSDGGDDALARKEAALAASLDLLRQHYDFVLVDVGPLEGRREAGLPALGSASGLKAAIVIHNLRATSPERLAEVEDSLSAAGVAQIGVIQNFVRS